MKDYIYIEGEQVDAGFPIRTLFYGEGVFETFRYKKELPILFQKHLDRMEHGANRLTIPFPEPEHVSQLVTKAVTDSNIEDAYIKICLLSCGESSFPEFARNSQVLVIIKQYLYYDNPLRVITNNFKMISNSGLTGIKSMNYQNNILARRHALDVDYDEALFLNEREEIVECSASNIFWYANNALYTPSKQTGALCGTTRGMVIDLARRSGTKVLEGEFGVDHLDKADFVFITNSLNGCRAVSRINSRDYEVNHKLFISLKNEVLEKLNWL